MTNPPVQQKMNRVYSGLDGIHDDYKTASILITIEGELVSVKDRKVSIERLHIPNHPTELVSSNRFKISINSIIDTLVNTNSITYPFAVTPVGNMGDFLTPITAVYRRGDSIEISVRVIDETYTTEDMSLCRVVPVKNPNSDQAMMKSLSDDEKKSHIYNEHAVRNDLQYYDGASEITERNG